MSMIQRLKEYEILSKCIHLQDAYFDTKISIKMYTNNILISLKISVDIMSLSALQFM